MFTLRFEYLAPTITGFCDFLKTHFCHQSGRQWPDSDDTSAFESWSPVPHFGAIPGPRGAKQKRKKAQTLFVENPFCWQPLWSQLFKPEGITSKPPPWQPHPWRSPTPWGHFGITLGSPWGHFGVEMCAVALWGPHAAVAKSCANHMKII